MKPIGCCNSARQVRATTQPTRLQIRCNSASRVATELSRFVQRRNRNSCPCVATAHRLLQQRSVRQRRTAAREYSLLQQRIVCCNSAQQGRATTQLTAFPIRCNGASPVATALRTTTQQPVATQGSLAWRNRTCCSAARVATQCDLLQRTTARCNLLQPLQCCAIRCNRPQPAATCCSAVHSTACAAAIRPDATQHNLLQQTTVRCHAPQRVATCCNDRNAVQFIPTDHGPLQQTTARCNRPQPVATCCRDDCNTVRSAATDQQRNRLQHSAVCCNRPQPVATCCSDDCNSVRSAAIDRSQLQQTTASCNRLQR